MQKPEKATSMKAKMVISFMKGRTGRVVKLATETSEKEMKVRDQWHRYTKFFAEEAR